jgi:hypothetical protein
MRLVVGEEKCKNKAWKKLIISETIAFITVQVSVVLTKTVITSKGY